MGEPEAAGGTGNLPRPEGRPGGEVSPGTAAGGRAHRIEPSWRAIGAGEPRAKPKRSPILVELSIGDIPEVIWALRSEMAKVLREEADADANPAVSRRLREIASAFEAGRGSEG